ncbi:uncharacterized protein LOC113280448 [Papaver somniferum]|uniref:uncharacterized protein LOC113280448 n=1 Tax=Papaver somniferum TaxID=3469 RepID=UPI000E7015F5|nr:uncharacterized protein LOC113280448 [Papaver somniferum]
MDHFVGSCINATVLPYLASKLLGKSTAREKWLLLSKIFTQQFFARKSQLRSQLHSIRRGNSIVFDFLHQIKHISDSLAEIGEPVLDEDLVMQRLSCLGRDYAHFVITMQNREIPLLFFFELRSRLIHHEQWLKDQDQYSFSPLVADPTNSAFFVCKFSNSQNSFRSPSGNFTKNSSSKFSGKNLSGNSSIYVGNGGHSFKKMEFNPTQKQFADEIPYQICNQTGHFANRCRYRYLASKNGTTTALQKAFAGIEISQPSTSAASTSYSSPTSGIGESNSST